MTSVRCFVGVPSGPEMASVLLRAGAALRAADGAWADEKWVAAENLHLTLKFLGDVDDEDIEALGEAICEAVTGSEPFELALEGVVAVPDRRRCRMLWASFTDPGDACAALASRIDRTVTAFGIPPEKRPFSPHVTLCRARKPRQLRESALAAARHEVEGSPRMMSVPAARLYTSRLTPRGPIYCEIGAWPLGGEPPRRAESTRGAAGRR